MMCRPLVLVSLSAFAAVAFAADPSQPATELGTVTTRAPSPVVHTDVRSACPGIDAALQKTLASAWGRVQRAGTMRVRFRLEEGRPSGVSASGLSQDYQPYVRKAVGGLVCTSAAAEGREYRFLLVMQDPDDVPASDRFALLAEE